MRVHVGERALTTWLVLDVSASMAFGTARPAQGRRRRGRRARRRPRGDAARQPARRARVRRRRAAHPAPAPGPARAARAAGGAAPRARRPTAPARPRWATPVTSVARARPPAGWSWSSPTSAGARDWEGPLRALRARHGVMAVEILDPREQELPAGRPLAGRPGDRPPGRTSTRPAQACASASAAAAAAERDEVRAALRRAGADHVVLSTDGDWLRDFAGAPAPRAMRRGAMAPAARPARRRRARRAGAEAAQPAGGRAPRHRRARRRRSGQRMSFAEPPSCSGSSWSRWRCWPTGRCSGAGGASRRRGPTRRWCRT